MGVRSRRKLYQGNQGLIFNSIPKKRIYLRLNITGIKNKRPTKKETYPIIFLSRTLTFRIDIGVVIQCLMANKGGSYTIAREYIFKLSSDKGIHLNLMLALSPLIQHPYNSG